MANIRAGLLGRNPAQTYKHIMNLKTSGFFVNSLVVCWFPHGAPGAPQGNQRKREAGAQLRVRAGVLQIIVLASPRPPRGAAGKPTETRGWSTIADPRRASGQKPCADLHAHYEFENQRNYREISGCVLVSPRGPKGPAGRPAETRDWCTSAGQRKASL